MFTGNMCAYNCIMVVPGDGISTSCILARKKSQNLPEQVLKNSWFGVTVYLPKLLLPILRLLWANTNIILFYSYTNSIQILK